MLPIEEKIVTRDLDPRDERRHPFTSTALCHRWPVQAASQWHVQNLDYPEPLPVGQDYHCF